MLSLTQLVGLFALSFIVRADNQQPLCVGIPAASGLAGSTAGLESNEDTLRPSVAFEANYRSGLFDTYDDGLFTPLEDLHALSTAYSSIYHPQFPKYGVRIKKSTLCNDSAATYTGYIDIEARHLFFYFMESRNDPDKDDVIFWTNGGPGCSSTLGLFMELGPCKIHDPSNPEPVFNPYSWSANASIFFVDQPIGVGFSYADHGETVSTTEEAAKDIAAFVAIFFENFSKFKGRAFHMAGESYGGRYIPTFAAEVYDANAKLIEAGMTPINLSSIMIGNGCTEGSSMATSYYDMQCTPKSVPPVQDIGTCVRMKQAVPRCEKWLKNSCVDSFDSINCGAAVNFCNNEIFSPYFATGLNPYDISETCTGGMETLCYPVITTIRDYVNREDVREAIGASPEVETYETCSDEVGNAFDTAQDGVFPAQLQIAALLERGVRALIYVGANDWICNWVGNERMTAGLEWYGQAEFVQQPLREWQVDGKVAGVTKSAGPLTFVTIDGAGHMVPYDKPKESLELVKRWLTKTDL